MEFVISGKYINKIQPQGGGVGSSCRGVDGEDFSSSHTAIFIITIIIIIIILVRIIIISIIFFRIFIIVILSLSRLLTRLPCT